MSTRAIGDQTSRMLSEEELNALEYPFSGDVSGKGVVRVMPEAAELSRLEYLLRGLIETLNMSGLNYWVRWKMPLEGAIAEVLADVRKQREFLEYEASGVVKKKELRP